jgi:hypothetical protein
MKLKITIDIFSGRPNPVMELDGSEAADLLNRLAPDRKLKRGEIGPPPSMLGYRGMIVELAGAPARNLPTVFRVVAGKLFGEQLSHSAADKDVESLLCGPQGLAKRIDLGAGFDAFLSREMERSRHLADSLPPPSKRPLPPPIKVCLCAPAYDPAWWNDGGQVQHHNNCYNYATNYRTDTFAQPGKAAGAMYSLPIACASVLPAAAQDGLLNKPAANNKCPSSGHLVALVVAPGWDFHWFRKGPSGLWSHKPGGTAATNLDNSGKPIKDPRVADRGPYTEFCTFMAAVHGHFKLQ